jgi:Domain of unknown function (DUF3854)
LYQHSGRTEHYLSYKHEEMLFKESGIARDVVRERGVRTTAGGRELPKGSSWRQRRRGAGILFTVHRPNGETSWSFRPDEPDPKDSGRKYEQPSKHYGGPGNVLDVHPRMRHLIDDPEVEITFVEGIKKADALTSRGVLAVAITGVWNWLSDGEPITDMLEIPVDGRRVTICFDSDMLYNPNVQDACRRLAEYLTERGAEVWVTYLPDKPDGSKMGADDFLVAGGTISEFKMLMRRYDPSDFTLVRLSRDECLQLALEGLGRRFWDFEWKGMGGHSARDVYKVLVDAAVESGKVGPDGIRITMARRKLCLRSKVSSRTLYKAIRRLEDAELIYRDNENRKEDKAGAFVLRAGVNQYGEGAGDQRTTALAQKVHGGGLHLRASRLRWSSPGSKPQRGVVKGTRKVRKGTRRPPRDPIRRLGKIRGAIVDALEGSGPSTLEELAAVLHRARPRDLVRAKTSAGGRNGPVIMLLEVGIVEWVCEVGARREVLRLTPNWLEALENARRLGKEIEQEELDRQRHKRESEAYRNRHRVKPNKAPAEDEMRDRREGYAERRRQAIEEALSRLFAERPEYRTRRAGQVTCALINYIAPDFPRGQDGAPKDAEVEAILEGRAA